MLLSWDCIIKIFVFNLPGFQYFTADRMSLVSPPSSNGWTIPLNHICRWKVKIARICKPFKKPRNSILSLAELNPWNCFLGSSNVYRYGLPSLPIVISAGIFKQSMGTRNWVEYRPAMLHMMYSTVSLPTNGLTDLLLKTTLKIMCKACRPPVLYNL